MPTSAEIAAIQAALAARRAKANAMVDSSNAIRDEVEKDLPYFGPISHNFNAFVGTLNVYTAAIRKARADADLLVPTDEPPIDPADVPGALTLRLLHESEVSGFWFSSGAIINGQLLSTWGETRAWDCKTGKVTLTPAVVPDYNGNPLASTRIENGDCIAVGDMLLRGSQAPGGPFHRFDPATGIYTPLAATSYADTAMLYDKPAQRIIGISGGGFPFMQWRTPIPDAKDASGNLVPLVDEYLYDVVVPPCARYMLWRSCINVEAGRAMMFGDVAASEVYEMESGSHTFVHRPTTGTKPPDFSEPIYWPAWDAYIAFACGDNDPAQTYVTNKIYALRRSDWHWQELVINGIPAGGALSNIYQNIIEADPENEQILIINGNGTVFSLDMRGGSNVPTELPPDEPPVDEPPIDPPPPVEPPSPPPPPPDPTPVEPPTTPNVASGNYGTFSSYALPSDPYAPFNTQRGSKQVGMAMLDGQLFAGNGDWLHSATNGWWVYTLANGVATCQQLRTDITPTAADPFPDSLQDGCGMHVNPLTKTIWIVPGGYYAYHPEHEFARGIWKYFRDTNTFRQYLGICGRDQENVGTGLVNVGNLYGGAYDDLNEHVLVFLDESHGHPTLGKGVATYDLANELILPFQPFTLTPPANDLQAIVHNFTTGRFTRIGRKCYFTGYSLNPYSDPWKSYYRLWSWHIDEHVVSSLAFPPVVEIGGSTDAYIQLLSHGNKLLLIVSNDIANGGLGKYDASGNYTMQPIKLLVYDTLTDKWAQETGWPDDGGSKGGNTFCESEQGIAICGNDRGGAPSHLRFYKPAQEPFAQAA